MGARETILGITIVLLVLAVLAGLMAIIGGPATGLEQEFLDLVDRKDVDGLQALFHPALAREVDSPILEIWLTAMQQNLGSTVDVLEADSSSSWEGPKGKHRITWQGRVRFQQGEAQVRFVETSGRLVEFEVASRRLKSWFHRPPDEMYQRLGEEFLRSLLQGWEEDAMELMHPNLRQVMPLERLQEEMKAVRLRAGELQRIELVTAEYSPDEPPSLELTYRILGARESAWAPVMFQFQGMKGHLLGFHITFEEPG